MSAKSEPCCVAGCSKGGAHRRTFEVTGCGLEASEVYAWFCCEHLDQQESEEEPFIDIVVAAEVRAPRKATT